MQVIVYPTETGVAVVWPAPDFDAQAVAAKDVPEGKPFAIIDSATLPDYSTRDRWIWANGAVEMGPEKTHQTTQITFAQLLIGLVAEGWITEAEGDAWLTGTPPAPALALIGQLPQGQRFAAKARAIRPSIVLLSDPLVQALAAAQGKSPEQLDDFFRAYAGV